jgi:hypothetical protein
VVVVVVVVMVLSRCGPLWEMQRWRVWWMSGVARVVWGVKWVVCSV